MVNLLVPLGFVVPEAKDGQEGLRLAQTLFPDLIVTDLVMPVMDGFEFVRCLRHDAHLKNIPVIASSASTFDQDKKQSLAVGCNEFLPKPIDADDLFHKIQQLLNLEWQYTRPVAPGPLAPAAPSVAPDPPTLSKLLQLARRGRLAAIEEQVTALEQENPTYQAFAAQVCRFTQNFEVEKLQTFLQEALT
ncbi:MAG: response regulator [Oscillatoriales cyanobacterium SM2_1_8]|nr:response regulator [Oscillatoriales cyanobacterium SM2_1_8]